MKNEVEIPDGWEELTRDTLRKWAEDFAKNHPIHNWINETLFKGKSLWDYAPGYALTHPWEGVFYGGRHIKWAWQRVFRGWDDRVIWSIDYYLAEMLPTWLIVLKRNKHGVPSMMFSEDDFVGENYEVSDEVLELREAEYDAILHRIAKGFVAYRMMDDVEYKSETWYAYKSLHQEGFELLQKYFGTLWD